MKTTILKSLLFTTLFAAVLTSCNEDYATPDLGCTDTTLVKTMEVEDVPASGVVTQFTDDEVIEAYVTSSDEGGNFFKTISFQTYDGDHAFSVPVDVTSTFINFEPGRKVYIKLKDLYTDVYNGGVRIGGIFVNSDNEAQVGRLPESQYRAVLNRSCKIVEEDSLVQRMTITEAMQDEHLNKLIEIDSIQFSDQAIETTYYDANDDLGGATNHLVTDKYGNALIFRTSSFANFAGKPVAQGSGKIRGVMTKFSDDYQFVARTERDIMLTDPRREAFFTENFQSASDGTNLNIPDWTNVAVSGTRVWREEAFDGNGYAEFSSFGTNEALNVAWLVTPPIDMDSHTNETLIFRTAQHHLDVNSPGNSLVVYISNNFTGDIATATWTQLDVILPTTADGWYDFVSSGLVEIDDYTGTVHIAFKFTGSGTDQTLDGAFQIDDVQVFGN